MSIVSLGKSAGGIETFLLENSRGMSAEIITYGARISRLCVPDRNGNPIDVVAGFDDADGFFSDNPYFNAVIGRVANRIGGAGFELDGKRYELYKNDGNNHLHGGRVGFDKKLWSATVCDGAIKLKYVSEDGEEGYPGALTAEVAYTLTEDNALKIEYSATADEDTPCSLTNHAYFNLDGDFKSVLEHEVFIRSGAITAVDSELIPTGEIKNICGTAYDFSSPKPVGRDISCDDFMLRVARGYDFNYVLDNDAKNCVASAYSKKSGICMRVYTDRPCMQFYTGNFLDGLKGKTVYGFQSAFCMETQGYPNACNIETFPSMLLKRNERYSARTEYEFCVE